MSLLIKANKSEIHLTLQGKWMIALGASFSYQGRFYTVDSVSIQKTPTVVGFYLEDTIIKGTEIPKEPEFIDFKVELIGEKQ